MTTAFTSPFGFVNPFACASPFGVQPNPFNSLTPWNAVPSVNPFSVNPFNVSPFTTSPINAYGAFTPNVNPFTPYGTINPFAGFNPTVNPFTGYNPNVNPFSTHYNSPFVSPFNYSTLSVPAWNNPITGGVAGWQSPFACATPWSTPANFVPFAPTPGVVPVVTSQHNVTTGNQPANASSNPNNTQAFVSFFPAPFAGPFGIGGYWTSTQQASSWSTPANGGCSTTSPVGIQRNAA